MKPKEFYEIMTRFVEEDKRWRTLEVGDIIYNARVRWGDINYQKMVIDSIDVDERQITAHDVEGSNTVTLREFLTQNEYIKNR